MKKIIITAGLLAMAALITTLLVSPKNPDSGPALEKKEVKRLRLAVCPTYHEAAKKLDSGLYQIVFTGSTAESLIALQKKQADIILAGRILKPGEPKMDYLLLTDKGYSFLSNREISVYKDGLINYNIYTDLDLKELNQDFDFENIEKVPDVYEYLAKGIIITAWENTDYEKAEIVHLWERNGQRAELSRRPALFCPGSCAGEEIIRLTADLKIN